jgi:hypothetical protein
MSINKAFMNLSGAMDLIKMSKNPLAPIYEAMTNSLEAFAQRPDKGQKITNEINVHLYFSGLLDDCKELEQVDVIDNGIGFTEENYNRFCEFFDKSKGYDNRGTGRLQYFHRFQKIKVNSIFESEGEFFRRTINTNKNNFIVDEDLVSEAALSSPKTIVSLLQYLPSPSEKEYFNNLTIDEIASSIKSHFLLRFYLDKQKEGFQAPKV